MSQTNHPPDALDQAFADYFGSQMPRPWPAAPAVASAAPARPATDPSRRARWTLAASVALVLGGCWFLSNGSQPGSRSTTKPGPAGVADPFAGSTATMPDALKGRPKAPTNTKQPGDGFKPGSINLP
ncbi:MAG: hypothetical protein K2X82_07310 [Gemmataceae bacterium]|nr:hypothetical protein [Gemmataceae bacterium]